MNAPSWRDSVVLRWMLAALGLVLALSVTQELARPETTDLISAGTAESTLRRAVPILLAGLGGIWAERAGVVNIGLEGMMILGTWFGAWGALEFGPWWGMAIGAAGGAAGGLLHAVATVGFGVDHIISGVAINILAPALTRFLSREVFADRPGGGITQSPRVESVSAVDLPFVSGGDLFGWTTPDLFQLLLLIATGFFSFGLWVHHMFTTGIPTMSLAFFSAASMAVAIPSGLQFFSWIATFASARKKIDFNPPTLFVLGMICIFLIGGLTGVMVAMVPFNWQVHDTYFIVAHLHYVLIGGMVFPLFATFYYWVPIIAKKQLSKRLGQICFWLMFVGFNVTFFPMHIAGMMGMPRRIWTYPDGIGWEPYNLISTIGAFILALGVLVFIIDLIRNFRVGEGGKDNPWGAGTLEFLPQDVYSTRSIPHVHSREPLWDDPDLARSVAAGEQYLPNAPTGGRETIVTSPSVSKLR